MELAQRELDYVLMQRQDSGALTQASPRLDFQPSPPEEKRLPPAQFIPLGPTVDPSFTPEEDSRKVRLEKTDPSMTTNIERSPNQAQQNKLIKFLINNWDIFA